MKDQQSLKTDAAKLRETRKKKKTSRQEEHKKLQKAKVNKKKESLRVKAWRMKILLKKSENDDTHNTSPFSSARTETSSSEG